MSYTNWREKMKKNAEVIFDREEPVGQTTDMVLPERRWFRKNKTQRAAQPQPAGHRLTSA